MINFNHLQNSYSVNTQESEYTRACFKSWFLTSPVSWLLNPTASHLPLGQPLLRRRRSLI
jgi:hypothetical protein